MLNKSHSKKRNAIKIGLVLPFIAIFLYGFNVKEVQKYVEIPADIEIPLASTDHSNELTIPDVKDNRESIVHNQSTPSTILVSLERISTAGEISHDLNNEKFIVQITKHTSESELQKIKEELKSKYNIDLKYSTNRNESGEIVSISMNYGGQQSSGNYQVTDEDGINDFYFFIDEEGKSGFGSDASEERKRKRMEVRMEKQSTRMEQQREEMEQRRADREMEMKERKIIAIEVQELEKERQKVRLKKIDKDHVYVIAKQDDNHDSTSDMEYVVTRLGPRKDIIYVSDSNPFMINRLTTDAELDQLKEKLSSKNIDFNYRNVKRNAQGEITSLKFTVNDHKGSKSTTVAKGEDGKPIDEFIIRH